MAEEKVDKLQRFYSGAVVALSIFVTAVQISKMPKGYMAQDGMRKP